MNPATLKVNELVLVDIGGHYAYARVDVAPENGLILLECMTGGYVGGPLEGLDIVPANDATPGITYAREWLKDLIADGN